MNSANFTRFNENCTILSDPLSTVHEFCPPDVSENSRFAYIVAKPDQMPNVPAECS